MKKGVNNQITQWQLVFLFAPRKYGRMSDTRQIRVEIKSLILGM